MRKDNTREMLRHIPVSIFLLGVNLIQICTAQTDPNIFRIQIPQNETEYKYAWMTTDYPGLVLRMRACSEGYIALAREPEQSSQHMYFIAVTNETISITRREQRLPDKVIGTTPTPDGFLGCNIWKYMWVSWEDYNITVGKGQMIGANAILAADDSERGLSITALSVSSSEKSKDGAKWEIRRDYVRAVFVSTSRENSKRDIWITENERGYIVFGVRSCKQARLFLNEGIGKLGKAYTIVLGAKQNRISKIIKGEQVLVQVDTPDLVDCDETKYFWISWLNGVIEVGRGMRLRDRLFMSTPPGTDTSNLTALTIDSRYDNAHWQFRSIEENTFLLLSEAGVSEEDEHIIDVSHRNTFIFRVRACRNAILELKRSPTSLEVEDKLTHVRLTLGTQGNKESLISCIKENGQVIIEDTLSTPNVLACKFMRSLWFSWKGSDFKLGTGSVPFENEIATAKNRYAPLLVETLQLASKDKKNKVEWQIAQSQGRSVQIRTQPAYSHTQAWYTVADDTSLVFKVRAERSARFLLATFLGNPIVDNYEILLQNEEGISKIMKGASLCISEKTSDILSDSDGKFFWVNWHNGHIEVGQGKVVGQAVMLVCDDTERPYEINAVSFAGDMKTEWTLSEAEGPRYVIYTNAPEGEDALDNFWLATHRHIFPFQVMAPDPVTIVLTRVPGQAQDGDIEVYVGIEDNTAIGMEIRGDKDSFWQNKSFDVLSSTELRDFWITWYNTTLMIGRSSIWYDNIVLMATLDVPIKVTGIILSNFSPAMAEWRIDPELATVLRKKTPAKYWYNQLWKTFHKQTSVLFTVKAKEAAHLLLSPGMGVGESIVDISIGDDLNRYTVIRNSTSDKDAILAKERTTKPLNESEFRSFWASWDNGYVRVGKGVVAGVDSLVEASLTDPVEFHSLSIATETYTGEWEISNVASNAYHIKTPAIDGPWKYNFLQMHTSRNDFQFTVLTCTRAHIALFTAIGPEPAVHTSVGQLYEVVITREAVILYKVRNQEIMEELTRSSGSDAVIECGHSQAFWISWGGGLIKIGQGSWPNRILIEYMDLLGFGLNAFSFGGGGGEIAVATHWEITPGMVDKLVYQTFGERDYDQFWTTIIDSDFLTFELKTCGNASIILSELPGVIEINTYEIDIGNGQKNSEEIVIRKNGEVRMTERIFDVVSCSETWHFWVSWRDNVISFGQVSFSGEDGLIHWRDEDAEKLTVRSVAASSYGGTRAVWGFLKLQDNMFEVVTPDSKDELASYAPAWFPPLYQLNKLSFTVMACKNARLGLIKDPSKTSSTTYEVLLGAVDEATGAEYSALRRSVNGTNVSIKRTSRIISCTEPRDFWVTWNDNEIHVGVGQYPGQQILHYKEPGLGGFKPNGISMAAGPDTNVGGRWAFPLEQTEGFHIKTSSDVNHYNQFWMSVRGRHRIIFSIKSCGFAKLALSSIPFETNKETYEIEIQNSDGYTAIRNGIAGPFFNKTKTSGLLSCSEYNTFWLWLTNNSVVFGEGTNPNHGEIVKSYQALGAYRVASIGITMGGKYDGIWNFPRSRGNVFRALTSPDTRYGNSWLILSPDRDHMTFQVRACADAHIVLVATAGDWSQDTVEVVLGSYSNTRVEIRDSTGGKDVARKAVPHILDCNIRKPFWISWKDGIISVGTGGSMGRPLVSWPFKVPGTGLNIPFNIQAASFSTGTGEGEWEMDQHYEECESSFKQMYSKEDGMRSGCRLLQADSISVNSCKKRTCDLGGNAFNYRGAKCRVIKCTMDDYELFNSTNPADIYTLQTVAETYMALTNQNYAYDQHWVGVTGRKSVTFMVRSCGNAHLALAAIPGNIKTMAYEVVIGALGNRRSMIRRTVGWFTNPVTIVNTPHIVHCGELRPFWISWKNNGIRVGRGLKVGMEPFLTWEPQEEIHIINSIGISTGEGVLGQWAFGSLDQALPSEKDKEDNLVFTTKSYEKDQITITPSQNSFIFEVRACSDALINIRAVEGHDDIDSIEVKIGTEKNSKTTLKLKGPESNPPVVKDTPDILNCAGHRTFWLSWENSAISLGKGSSVGQNQVASLPIVGEFPLIHSVSFATDGVEGYWNIARSMGFYLNVVTPTDVSSPDEPMFYSAWIVEEVDNYLVFQVKACTKVFMLLSYNINETDNSYLVSFGSGDAYIRDGLKGSYLSRASIKLNCNQMFWFWVRWYQGLEVGKDRVVGKQTFLSTHDPVGKPIRVVSLSSSNDGNDVTWIFPDIADDTFYMPTLPNKNMFQDAWVYSASHSIDFEVLACPEATVYLGRELPSSDWEKSTSYTITLANGNSSITRYPLYPNSTLLSTSTPWLVQCDRFTKISIQWSGETIRVLSGGKSQQQTVMYVQEDGMLDINTVSFGAPSSATVAADWRFPRHMGKGTLIATPNGHTTYSKWLSVGSSEKSLVFKLHLPADGHIILCQFVGVLGKNCYEIVVNEDISSSCIKSSVKGEKMKCNEGRILDGEVAAYYWVSWERDVIEFGLGATVGYESYLKWDASDHQYLHPVNAISVMSFKTGGTWEFSQIEDRFFEVTTPLDSPASDMIWLRLRDSQFAFKVATCPTATVFLTQKAGDTKSQRFEIFIERNKATIRLRRANGETEDLRSKVVEGDLLMCAKPTAFIVQVWQSASSMSLYLKDEFGKVIVNANFVTTKADMQVEAVTFGTDTTAEGVWRFSDTAAMVSTFKTSEVYNDKQLTYKVASKNHMYFTVKSKGPAHVILQEHHDSETMYEFVIGLENNQKIGLRMKRISDVYVAMAETPGILDKNALVPFWVSWSKARVAIGQGRVVEEGVILAYTNEEMFKIAIQYASFTTGWGSNGTWEFSKYKSDQVLLKLPGMGTGTTARYMLSSGQTEILFSARYCNGGLYMILESDLKTTLYEVRYEMVFGAFLIYRLDELVHRNSEYFLTSCHEDQVLWLSWKDGLIVVALGGPAGRRLVEWQDPDPLDIYHVHFETFGVDLVLPRFMGSSMEFLIAEKLKDKAPYEAFWYTLHGRTDVIFALTSPKDGKVMFSQTPLYSLVDGYEVQITKINTTLTEFSTGKVLDSSSEPGLFNKGYPSYFWASWDKGDLKVGEGALVGQKQLLHTYLPPDYDIIAAGFDATRTATWTFNQDTGNTYLVMTAEDNSYKQAWFMPKSDTFIFSVVARLEARIMMLEAPDNHNAKELELVLGAFDNTGSLLFDSDKPVKTVEGRGIVNNDTYKRFWIQWKMSSAGDTMVFVGEGSPGGNAFMNYTVAKGKRVPLSTIGLGESMVSSAAWKVPQDQEVMTRFVSVSTGKINHWFTVVGRKNVVFRLTSCTAARILLVSELGNQMLPSTEIVLDRDGMSYIIDSTGAMPNVTKKTPGLLDCVDHRAYWVHWTRKLVLFGRGATIKKNTLMRFKNKKRHQVMGMGLAVDANDKDYSATWEFFRHTGNVVYEKTSSETQYLGVQIRPADLSSFQISGRVRTCAQAIVGLFPPVGIHQSEYKVVFGAFGNSRSEIRRGNVVMDSALTPMLMRESVDAPIWVRWESGKNLTAGAGVYPDHPLLSFVDPNPWSLLGVGFSSGGTCEGNWAIDMNIGDMIFMETPGGFSNAPTTVSLLDTHQLKFRLKALHAAHIALSVIPGHLHTYTYEFVLQELITGNSYIKRGIGGEKVASAHTPGILSNEEYRSFWITWRQKIIEFGTGETPSIEGRLLYYDKVDLPPFAMVTFASYTTSSATWEINVEKPTTSTTTTTTTTPTTTTTTITTTTSTTTSSTESSQSSSTTKSTTSSSGKPTPSPGTTSTSPGGSTTPDEGANDEAGALSAGEVVGIVFGCILGAMLILFTVLFILVRMRGASSGERIRLTSDAGFSNAAFDLNDVPLDDQSES